MKSRVLLFSVITVIIVAVAFSATGFSKPGDAFAVSEMKHLNGSVCYTTSLGTAICASNCGFIVVAKGRPISDGSGKGATWQLPPKCDNVAGCSQGYWLVGSSGCSGG